MYFAYGAWFYGLGHVLAPFPIVDEDIGILGILPLSIPAMAFSIYHCFLIVAARALADSNDGE
jgi:hypothetical protein